MIYGTCKSCKKEWKSYQSFWKHVRKIMSFSDNVTLTWDETGSYMVIIDNDYHNPPDHDGRRRR